MGGRGGISLLLLFSFLWLVRLTFFMCLSVILLGIVLWIISSCLFLIFQPGYSSFYWVVWHFTYYKNQSFAPWLALLNSYSINPHTGRSWGQFQSRLYTWVAGSIPALVGVCVGGIQSMYVSLSPQCFTLSPTSLSLSFPLPPPFHSF